MEHEHAEYLTREEHRQICDDHHRATMEWAKEVVTHSINERKELWNEVNELKKIPGKLQTWFIILLCAGIVVPFISAKLSKNGEAEMFKAQYQLSKTNDRNIETIMNYLKLPYTAPNEYPMGEKK